MQHFSTFAAPKLLKHALLLALSAAGLSAWGQSFGPLTSYASGGSFTYDVALGDVNGDGRLDIITSFSLIGGQQAVGALLAQPSGGFSSVVAYPALPLGQTGGISTVTLADVNGDGRLDAVTANGIGNTVGVLLGLTGGTFAPVVTYPTGSNTFPKDAAVGDVNGDGRPDIVTANNSSNSVSVLLGQPSGGFSPATIYTTGTTVAGYNLKSVALGDVNGDGRTDILATSIGGSGVAALLGQASGGFVLAPSYGIPSGNYQNVTLGDVNGDGRLDVVVVDGSNRVGVLLSQAGGGLAAAVYYAAGSGSAGSRDVALGDLNGDGRLDICVFNNFNNSAGILVGQPAGSFMPVVEFSMGQRTVSFGDIMGSLALGDMNGDGRLDLAAVCDQFSTVGVRLNTGTYTPLATARPTAADFTLAPNPAHDAFTVTLPAACSPTGAELLNALGQVVRRLVVGTASFQVEASGLAPGIYTLRLHTSSGVLAQRVAVE